jgi:hypothetical protein
MAMCRKFGDDEMRRRLDAALQRGAVSASSHQVYVDAMRRAKAVVDSSVCALLMRPNESYARLDAALRPKSVQTLATTVGGLLATLKHTGLREDLEHGGKASRFGKRWLALYKPLMKELDDRRREGVPTERQAAGAVSWLRVMAKNDELIAACAESGGKGDRLNATLDALLSSIYVDMEPRRQGDYRRVYLQRSKGDAERAKKEPAHVDLTLRRPTIEVREFKTAKTTGPWRAQLPARTAALMAQLPAGREYLFAREDGRPFSVSGYTDYHNRKLKAWFGPKASNNSLRHARASVIQSDFTMSAGEKDAAAEAMGHSPGMNRRYAYLPTASGTGATVEIVGRGKDGKAVVYECRPKAR